MFDKCWVLFVYLLSLKIPNCPTLYSSEKWVNSGIPLLCCLPATMCFRLFLILRNFPCPRVVHSFKPQANIPSKAMAHLPIKKQREHDKIYPKSYLHVEIAWYVICFMWQWPIMLVMGSKSQLFYLSPFFYSSANLSFFIIQLSFLRVPFVS